MESTSTRTRGKAFGDQPGGLDAIRLRHVQVHEHYVGLLFIQQGQ
jgi:hypothetical protein